MDNSINTVSTNLGSVADDTYNYINQIFSNPLVITILIIVIIVYLVIFVNLGGSSQSSENSGGMLDGLSGLFGSNGNNADLSSASGSGSGSGSGSSSSNILTIIVIIFFIILVVINGLQYFFSIDIIATLKNLFTGDVPELDIEVDNTGTEPIPELKLRPQVFNIPGNNYVYADAKALCSAYGGRLATYKEVEDSYNSGGEWCNYGWSDNQMALYPTQQKTYDELQKIKGHENDCGRPGVNGGYIANPAVRFGVNCFGYKPKINQEEEELMATEPLYPKTAKDIAMEKRVEYWKDKLGEIIVSPFNHNSWSKM